MNKKSKSGKAHLSLSNWKIPKMSPNIPDLSLKHYYVSKLSFFILKIEDARRSTRGFMSVYDSALLVNECK